MARTDDFDESMEELGKEWAKFEKTKERVMANIAKRHAMMERVLLESHEAIMKNSKEIEKSNKENKKRLDRIQEMLEKLEKGEK